MAKPTIIDVAARAGVSKSTVSLVLQDSPLVKAATRAAVQRAMADLGYEYNAAAAGLRGRARPANAPPPNAAPPKTAPQDVLPHPPCAFLSCDLADPPSAAFAAALHAAAAAQAMGVYLLPAGAAHSGRKITTLPAEANDPNTLFALHPDAPARLQEGMAAQTATRHLLGLSAGMVAFIGGSKTNPHHALRLRGYLARMQKAKMPPLHLAGAEDHAIGRAGAEVLLDQHPLCRAALCINDDVALGVLAALKARGITPGEGFRVVGWGDSPAAAQAGLSSMRPNWDALARACLTWVQHGGAVSHEIALTLMRRASSMGGA